MCTTSPHGAQARPCEDCLGERINRSAEQAFRDRTPTPLWARQRRFRIRLASTEMLRRTALSA